MANTDNITAWITFFIGLYAVGAGIGEFRQPGFWEAMLREVRASNALRFLTGIITLALGATIYLVNPYDPTDPLSILITVIGAGMFIEGILIFAFGDWFMKFAGRLMGQGKRIWAVLAIVLGIAAMLAALMRLQA